MGRLFTYMVKAAAEQQPAPFTGYYGTWGSRNPYGSTGVYSLPNFYQGTASDRWNAIDRLFSASQNVDSWNALAGNDKTNWGADYLTAIDTRFTSPEAIYDALSKNSKYLEAIQHLANTGSYDEVDKLLQGWNRNNPNDIGSWSTRSDYRFDKRDATDYNIADGVGNAQLILNLYRAEEARRKKAAEEVPSEPASTASQPAAPQPTVNPQSAPKPAPVQAPAIPEVIGPDGRKYISSDADRKAQTAAGIGAALAAGQNPFAAAPGASGPTRVNMNAGQDAVRNRVNSNINAGRSMYGDMGDAGKFMTADQRRAMNTATAAARPYEGSGLRMVGHSADGRTQTYVGRSGRGRITVGDDAMAGHYRGAGAVDTNPQSRYKTTQSRVQSPVKPPQVR